MKDYKKILEGVVNIISTTGKSDIGFANICTYIGENCPELKESEDERTIKELIIYLKSILSNKKYGDKFIEGWIAWLEKQCQVKDSAISQHENKTCKENVNSLTQEPVSEDLEEAINTIKLLTSNTALLTFEYGFRKGAEWQKKQMMAMAKIAKMETK